MSDPDPQFPVIWDRFADIPPFSPVANISMRSVTGQNLMMNMVTLDPGAVVPIHSHSNEQSGYVVRGTLVLTIAGETRRLGPGDCYVAPANVPHGATTWPTAAMSSISSARLAWTMPKPRKRRAPTANGRCGPRLDIPARNRLRGCENRSARTRAVPLQARLRHSSTAPFVFIADLSPVLPIERASIAKRSAPPDLLNIHSIAEIGTGPPRSNQTYPSCGGRSPVVVQAVVKSPSKARFELPSCSCGHPLRSAPAT